MRRERAGGDREKKVSKIRRFLTAMPIKFLFRRNQLKAKCFVGVDAVEVDGKKRQKQVRKIINKSHY